MRAHKYLSKMNRLDATVNNKLKEKQQVMELMLKVGDTNGKSRARLRALDREIDDTIDRLVDLKREAMRLLEALPQEEYRVLHQYYVHGRTMEVIAAEQGMSVRNTYIVKARALGLVQEMLDAMKKAPGR